MESKKLAELAFIMSNIDPLIVSSIKKIDTNLNATGCFVIYREKKFLITVKHAFAKMNTNGDNIEISICRDEWLPFGGVFYKHSFADVAIIQITQEGFSPKNYFQLSDKKLDLKTTDAFAILGYQNIDKMNCLEKPLLQRSMLKTNEDQYQDVFSGVAIPGYSGSAILLLTNGSAPELVGILSRSRNQLLNIATNKDVKEEGSEVIIEDYNVISSSRFAILETLNLAFE